MIPMGYGIRYSVHTVQVAVSYFSMEWNRPGLELSNCCESRMFTR